MNKCKLALNEELLQSQGKTIRREKRYAHWVTIKHCLKCGKEFSTSSKVNFILCPECGKMPLQKHYKVEEPKVVEGEVNVE